MASDDEKYKFYHDANGLLGDLIRLKNSIRDCHPEAIISEAEHAAKLVQDLDEAIRLVEQAQKNIDSATAAIGRIKVNDDDRS